MIREGAMVETRSPKGEEQAQDPSPVVIGGCFLQCRYSGLNFCPTYFLCRDFTIVTKYPNSDTYPNGDTFFAFLVYFFLKFIFQLISFFY